MNGDQCEEETTVGKDAAVVRCIKLLGHGGVDGDNHWGKHPVTGRDVVWASMTLRPPAKEKP